jgi:hypothetical protein
MEVTCSRCHQAIPVDSCFCPTCGLPQLVYSSEAEVLPGASERRPETVRDAGSIDWKVGMRTAIALAVPAGLLSSEISPLGAMLGVFWVAGAAAWAVVLYSRSQRPARITVGAGARIGLVTGLIAGWLAFAVSGGGMFVTRVALHKGNEADAVWKQVVDATEQNVQQFEIQAGMSSDATQAEVKRQRDLMLSPEGHAGFAAASLLIFSLFMVLFAVAGGAIGARSLGKNRSLRPEV